ncbi:hypothetical protein N9C93_00345 [Pelagibacterales bacterium]|nr:hypothetical protein [Pelagibacterales bacterium]
MFLLITLLISFFLFPYSYIKFWSIYKKEGVATGYGFTAIIFIILLSLYYQVPNNLLYSLFVIFIFSLIYWFDDFQGLPIILRFLIQFVTGLLIALLIFDQSSNYILYSVAAGLLNIILTNILNFYDGLDLNISLLLLLISFSVLIVFFNDLIVRYGTLAIIFYLIAFVYFNSKPQSIYLGDSGAFTFASLITTLVLLKVLSEINSIVFIAIPISLPAMDIFYVIILRLYLNEKLYTRNYHHLYHVIFYNIKGYYYLLPQLINFSIIYLLYFLLNNFFEDNFFLIILICVIFTPINYIIIRKISFLNKDK